MQKAVSKTMKNIVEAYGIAARASKLNAQVRFEAFEKVISFCESDDVCSAADTVQRNMLLFWAYNNLAEVKFAEKKYGDALDLWYKSSSLLKESDAKIALGTKMLESADKGAFSIPEKAKRIFLIAGYLQEAYREKGDYESASRLDRLKKTADYLLHSSERKN